MEKEMADALIGQLAADSIVRDALLIALMEQLPALHNAIEAKVAAVAHGTHLSLPESQRQHFQDRLQDVLGLMRNAQQP